MVAAKKKVDKKEKIIYSARKLFMKKGFGCTSIREISKDAGVNLALLNYYFNSKEALFDLIYDEIFTNLVNNISKNMPKNNSSIEIISYFIDVYIEQLIKEPEIAGFIFQEVSKNPYRLTKRFKNSVLANNYMKSFFDALDSDMQKGVIRKIEDPIMFAMNIISVCAFPFISKSLVKEITGDDDDEFVKKMRLRKKEVIDIFQNYLTKIK